MTLMPVSEYLRSWWIVVPAAGGARMDRAPLDIGQRRLAVDRVAEHVEHSRENPFAHRRLERAAEVSSTVMPRASPCGVGAQLDPGARAARHFAPRPRSRCRARLSCTQDRIDRGQAFVEAYLHDAAAYRDDGAAIHGGSVHGPGVVDSPIIGISILLFVSTEASLTRLDFACADDHRRRSRPAQRERGLRNLGRRFQEVGHTNDGSLSILDLKKDDGVDFDADVVQKVG